MVTTDEDLRACQARCRPYLARLAMLASGESDAPLPPGAGSEVTEATAAILAEAQAAGHAVAAATAPRAQVTEFLTVRLARLQTAAAQAITAARRQDPAALRACLRRFDTLTGALWTVQQAVGIPAPRPPEAQ